VSTAKALKIQKAIAMSKSSVTETEYGCLQVGQCSHKMGKRALIRRRRVRRWVGGRKTLLNSFSSQRAALCFMPPKQACGEGADEGAIVPIW